MSTIVYRLHTEYQFDKSEAPRIVHRLDKDTTGVLLLARTRHAAARLSELFRSGNFFKEYLAQISAWPKKTHGKISAPLALTGEVPLERMSIVPEPEGREAVTEYLVLDRREDVNALPVAFVKLWPHTGRKHQLRVHCADVLRAPILGDRKYGFIMRGEPKGSMRRKGLVTRMPLYLHLYQITLPAGWLDPEANVPAHDVNIMAPPPFHMQFSPSLLEAVRPETDPEDATKRA
ncbi:pseudouridine synthase [Thamnocephalis sphaerospora]|uniref:Pseudouridine synthase n=1 Tax=Thamnocephalis sphaerospora TaxID=78915 RepID=A0A4P9XGB3_9FUNG|nr:pseudouridine synthase [Thamnocephalis sphaerospora]|eukprot:RKP04642.1 pseudouridine synthase [Thamnocephalis sphaerospora]